MKQRPFEDRYTAGWQAFAAQLDHLERQHPPKNALRVTPLPVVELPAAYRQLCQQLAIARNRRYSGSLVARLNQLGLRAHQQIYRAPQRRWQVVLDFLTTGFPQRVRADARLFWLCAALFYLPLFGMGWAVYQAPELIYSLLSPESVADLEAMYAPGKMAGDRDASTDLAMFGYYIHNNIGLGFRTFAGGMLLGAGSAFMLLLNGVFIGAVSGYLTARGFIETFYTFIAGHGAFELTGIVLAGVAGLKMGWAIVAPGRLRRAESLRQAATGGIQLILGVAAFLVLAAFIEAFWSSNQAIPADIKYTVGASGWLLVILYLTRAGRRAS
ncbi:MAG TPA: stage II sporulation protein M [Candidatus Competibacteraceae bacterium]|nr:stage II sporulation protein M [Candidatus Competibacteraceae bacterium]MCP5132277.1 stage II sporulation protein M [Gammaproteobacteria bacterium]HPF59886.1 stage II sporulation protein M [Candidatus Competibacteraceae bacterium]